MKECEIDKLKVGTPIFDNKETLENNTKSKFYIDRNKNTNSEPTARNNHCSVVFNDKIYIHGGHDGKEHLDDLWIYSTKDHAWS